MKDLYVECVYSLNINNKQLLVGDLFRINIVKSKVLHLFNRTIILN